MRYKMLFILIMLAAATLFGCQTDSESEKDSRKNLDKPLDEIARCYEDIYDKVAKKGVQNSLETKEKIVKRLGDQGYTAVDYDNQINMVNAEKAEQFCTQAQKDKEAELTLIIVADYGSLIRYDLKSQKGEVKVEKTSLAGDEQSLHTVGPEEFKAHTWSYTKKGYLMFERYRPEGFDGDSGHVAVRIKPRSKRCRELDNQYVRPVGYHVNNMFITDWSENDYQSLNFYDLYERMYKMKYKEEDPYDFAFGGDKYQIPEQEFEAVFQSFFLIDSETLRQKTTYHAESHTYEYRPRGMFDMGNGPDGPYPEVVSYEEMDNGTVKLMIEAVWPEKNQDQMFSHELTVRPLSDGVFQYVSNQVLSSGDNEVVEWYTDRLTEEEWDRYYGEMN